MMLARAVSLPTFVAVNVKLPVLVEGEPRRDPHHQPVLRLRPADRLIGQPGAGARDEDGVTLRDRLAHAIRLPTDVLAQGAAA